MEIGIVGMRLIYRLKAFDTYSLPLPSSINFPFDRGIIVESGSQAYTRAFKSDRLRMGGTGCLANLWSTQSSVDANQGRVPIWCPELTLPARMVMTGALQY
jgi:hypothetical protein